MCGEPCKRSDVAELDGFVYVGDGFSDRCVAQAATRVFARDGLATYLAGKGVAFERFDDFYDVASALDGGAVVPPDAQPRPEDVARLALGRPRDLTPQRLDGRARDLVDRLLDRGERRVRPRRGVDPVEADDGELAGHVEAAQRRLPAARRWP